jgi:tetratricopeptide (TPR) repeat protein
MAQDKAAGLWLEIGRARAEHAIRQQLALLPRFLAARAARRGEPRAQAQTLLGTPPEVLLKQLSADATASEALLLYGDSWLKYEGCPAHSSSNMAEELTDRGFTVYDRAAFSGARVLDLAKPGNIDRLAREYRRAVADKRVPKAFILCGGGNDAVGNGRFYDLLNDADSGTRGLNDAAVTQRVDGDIQAAYLSILGSIDRLGRQFFPGHAIPVLVHGYDFPVPDSRSACHLVGPWLGPHLTNRGYTEPKECRQIARALIERLNAMQDRLRALSGLDVKHISLTGTLSTQEADYREAWENELHPTPPGFGRITDVFLQKAGL